MTNKEAIEMLKTICGNCRLFPKCAYKKPECFTALDMAIEALEAQDGDAISRQAAIDALWKALYEYEDKTEKQFQESENLDVGDWIVHRNFVQNMNDIDRQTILDLPSVQPERTCVNCGRTVNNGGWYADGRTRCPIEEHYALPKDGYCHLWEKRNVTDDDYPERREE